MNILGISAYYHDSAAALVRDGENIAAARHIGAAGWYGNSSVYLSTLLVGVGFSQNLRTLALYLQGLNN